MANERARCLLIYAVQTWRAVGRCGRAAKRLRQDSDHRLGRRRAPARAPQSSPSPLGRSPSPPSPTAKAPRWAACRTHRHQPGASLGTALVGALLIASFTTGLVNGVQDSSAILANVTTRATTQLEAGVPVHLRQRPEGQLQKANVPPDHAGCDSETNSDVRLPRCAPCCGWSRSSPSSRCSSWDLSPPSRLGEPSPNWPPLIPHRRLPADPPVPLSSMPGQPTQAY